MKKEPIPPVHPRHAISDVCVVAVNALRAVRGLMLGQQLHWGTAKEEDQTRPGQPLCIPLETRQFHALGEVVDRGEAFR